MHVHGYTIRCTVYSLEKQTFLNNHKRKIKVLLDLKSKISNKQYLTNKSQTKNVCQYYTSKKLLSCTPV